ARWSLATGATAGVDAAAAGVAEGTPSAPAAGAAAGMAVVASSLAMPGSAPALGGGAAVSATACGGGASWSLFHCIHSSAATISQAKIRKVRVWFIRQAGSSRRLDHQTREGKEGQRSTR